MNGVAQSYLLLPFPRSLVLPFVSLLPETAQECPASVLQRHHAGRVVSLQDQHMLPIATLLSLNRPMRLLSRTPPALL